MVDPVTASAIIGGGVQILGGIFANSAAKKARKNAKADYKTSFKRMREAANLGGFNPLEVLRSTGGAGAVSGPTGAPPLASIDMISGGISSIADVATGKTAMDAKHQALKTEVLQREVDRLSNVGKQTALRTQNSVGRQGVSMPSNYTAVDDEFRQKKTNVHEKVLTSSGNVLDVPVGPEADEVISGYVLDKVGDAQVIRDHFKDDPSGTVATVAESALNSINYTGRLYSGVIQPLWNDIVGNNVNSVSPPLSADTSADELKRRQDEFVASLNLTK